MHPRQVSDLGFKSSNAHFTSVAKKLTSWFVYIHYLARWSHIIDEDLLRCIHNDDDAIYPLLFIVSRMYQLLSNIVFHRLGWCHQRLRVKHLSQETPCNSTSVIPSIIILFYQIKCNVYAMPSRVSQYSRLSQLNKTSVVLWLFIITILFFLK